jgi:hypothetical protein
MKTLNKKLIVTYETNSAPYSMQYELFDTPYIHPWINLWKKDYQNCSIESWLVNHTPNQLESLITRCNILVQELNDKEYFNLPFLSADCPQPILNRLHYEFESNLKNMVNQDIALELNQIIHQIEKIITDLKSEMLNYISIISPKDMNISIPLLPEYKLFAVNFTNWGDLVLGYATTGKNWFDAILDKDTELINRQEVKNKKEILPEFYCTYFHGENTKQHLSHLFHVDSNSYMYDNYNKLDKETKLNVPIGDLNELSFGKLILGHIDYSHFCTMENIDKDKFLNDLRFRKSTIKEWNLTKFTTFKKCISIYFMNIF